MSKLLAFFIALTSIFAMQSCDDDDDDSQPQGNDELTVLEGNITADMTLSADEKYLIRGKVYVNAPAKLTIPAGTILFGEKDSDGALIINRGAMIEAKGTADKPVIMTSQAPVGFRNRGDWGGLIILGKAYNSNGASATIEGVSASAGSENGVYGPGSGNANDADNSGTLQYVRIEYAGIALSQDNELNSLTMGSVGSATTIDHIMVSYANDDAYEWFGGSVNHKYLIAYSTNDDDFDTDKGYNGKVQFGLVVRDNGVADFSGSRAWESSSNTTSPVPTVGGISRHSAPVFSNVTVLGPRLFGTSIDTDYKSAVEINQSSAIKIHNSIITGFATTATFGNEGALVTGNVFSAAGNNNVADGASAPISFATDNAIEGTVTNIFGPYTAKSASNQANNNVYSHSGLPASAYQVGTSPYLTGAINLSADPFFQNVAYKGAFGTSADAGWNITSPWVNFDPNSATY
ncbi:cell shape-determining protein MreB [Chryseosolibacter indicus]|uniref:Cell shape-determining protein MreB n=1 Tax=Chryseosolibacter indicus TaxID=2782351 RepID=A0ABS5VSH7_9BACT|nr:cell shape-determining protein MreB [Chryseosolibacter indicus]MBT1704373.1 cell shape-determining protein MreB [Chryseosolibacter indicus]